MIKVFTPPQRVIPDKQALKIFLAGSIEMGKAENWQQTTIAEFEKISAENIQIFNPRRDSFDPNLEQSFENPVFNQQVTWELKALEKADIIIMNLLPETKSPISLLELGLHASKGKLRVCCPKDFWRRGNVEIVCDMFDIPLFEDFQKLISELKTEILTQNSK